jgi:hypothetical protein
MQDKDRDTFSEKMGVNDIWEMYIDSTKKDVPLLLLRETESKRTEALFSLEVASIHYRESHKEEGEEQSEPFLGASSLLDTLVMSLQPGWSFDFVFNGDARSFSWHIYAAVHGQNKIEARDNAYTLYHDITTASAAVLEIFRLHPVRTQGSIMQTRNASASYRRSVRTRYLEMESSLPSIGFAKGDAPGATHRQTLRVPLLKAMPNSGVMQIGDILALAPAPTNFRYGLTKVLLAPTTITSIDRLLHQLKKNRDRAHIVNDAQRPSVSDDAAFEIIEEHLALWMRRHSGVRIETTLHSNAPISDASVKLISERLLYPHVRYTGKDTSATGHEIMVSAEGILDLQQCLPVGFTLPPAFPTMLDLKRTPVAKTYNDMLPPLANSGIILGEASDTLNTELVRYKAEDRNRHCYIIGATGTGKSTLLANMIIQDMNNGEGFTLFDPHGDLFTQVLKALPPHRYEDLIIINPAREDRSVGINFLECREHRSDVEIHFIINELMSIFKRLYLAEMQGPVFEMYMRTALQLMLEQPKNQSTPTLLDIPRIFEDSDFRNSQIETCLNEEVVRFWKQTATRASGDNSLTNITSYIASKLNQFVYNNIMRRILCHPTTTLNFRNILDTRKILLVNLSKGFLGEINTKFLGMIILGKLFGAALSRTDSKHAKRTPHYLYIDEFQNFTTGTMAQMMAEARKYELRMILANQNLGQVGREHEGGTLLEAILGNVASMFAFRTGVRDAERIACYLKPNYSEMDIQYLPDYQVVAKMLVDGHPRPPFVFKTLPFKETAPNKELAKAVNKAYEKYCFPLEV